MWRLILLLLIAMAGFWFGKTKTETKSVVQMDFPLVEHKSFVIVLYAHNQGNWCKRALRSTFEQDYNNYRVILIDDASIDETEKLAKEFILANNQDDKVIYIKNESYLGPIKSLQRVINTCLDREIVVPLDAKDWFTSSDVLNRFNFAYQNPDVWLATSWGIEYPAYRMCDEGPISYYASLFKQISVDGSYLKAIKEKAAGKAQNLLEPLGFINSAPRR